MHGIVYVAYACECCDCPEFRDEIPLKEGECKNQENSNFWKKKKAKS